MRALALLCLALLALAGCLEPGGPDAPTPTTTMPTPTPQAEPLAMRTLDKGSFSPIGEDAREILRDAGAWDALWARHRANESAPAVDFAAEMVVAVVVHGPTGCGAMHLANVTHDAAARSVTTTIVLEDPGPQVQCLVAFEDVYHFVAVPAREGEARFVETTERTSPETGGPDGTYAFRTLAQGTSSGIADARREVLRDDAEWRAFWDKHTANVEPAPPLPEVDWARERVFVATAGDKPTMCWGIRVDGIVEEERAVRVDVTTTRPPPDRACGMAIGQPFHYVTYPLTSKPLRVVEAEA